MITILILCYLQWASQHSWGREYLPIMQIKKLRLRSVTYLPKVEAIKILTQSPRAKHLRCFATIPKFLQCLVAPSLKSALFPSIGFLDKQDPRKHPSCCLLLLLSIQNTLVMFTPYTCMCYVHLHIFLTLSLEVWAESCFTSVSSPIIISHSALHAVGFW